MAAQRGRNDVVPAELPLGHCRRLENHCTEPRSRWECSAELPDIMMPSGDHRIIWDHHPT
jgi:hypothetical protein